MKKYIFIAALLASAAITQAQQLQTSSFYEQQGILFNPSVAGVFQDPDTKGIAGVTYRNQWSGIAGSPQTFTAFGSFNIPTKKFGISAMAYSDETGPTSRVGLQLAFAKHIIFEDGGDFSIGIDTRLQQYMLDKVKLAESLGSDPVLGGSDNSFSFDAGFGISYTNKAFQVGASVSQLVQSKLDFYSGNLSRSEEGRLYRHYYFHARYNWDIDGTTTISPNMMMVYLPNAPTEVTIGATATYNKLVWWGLGYRVNQSWMLQAGLIIKKKFTLGYSYDIYQNPVNYFAGGNSANEFLLKYNF
jgi:type IX secretion system PorP/SprF family membrane protein